MEPVQTQWSFKEVFLENCLEGPKKKKKKSCQWDLKMPLLGIHPDKIIIQKDTHMPVFKAALFIIAKTWRHGQQTI